MKKVTLIVIIIVFTFIINGCKKDNNNNDNNNPITYNITVNEELPRNFNIGISYIDFKPYFIITDSNGNKIPVLDSMIDISKVDFNNVGDYEVTITYMNVEESITIHIFENITYEVNINEDLPTTFYVDSIPADFKTYFIITDSKSRTIDVKDDMIESNVDLTKVGDYYIKLTYQNISETINIKVIDREIISLETVFSLIKDLPLDNKGTAISKEKIKVRGTIYMDVQNETSLVYLTDGKHFIKLHGEKIHNYTIEGNVYDITCNYKAHIYQPTLEVEEPSKDIKFIKDVEPVKEIEVKEVTLSEIVKLKRENFVDNLNKGYLQSMLKVTGYLHLDTHNSKNYDYVLTIQKTYKKNITGYIEDGLYFKNEHEHLTAYFDDYEIISVYGVLYEWNTNRKNWLMYMDEELTIAYLDD